MEVMDSGFTKCDSFFVTEVGESMDTKEMLNFGTLWPHVRQNI